MRGRRRVSYPNPFASSGRCKNTHLHAARPGCMDTWQHRILRVVSHSLLSCSWQEVKALNHTDFGMAFWLRMEKCCCKSCSQAPVAIHVSLVLLQDKGEFVFTQTCSNLKSWNFCHHFSHQNFFRWVTTVGLGGCFGHQTVSLPRGGLR